MVFEGFPHAEEMFSQFQQVDLPGLVSNIRSSELTENNKRRKIAVKFLPILIATFLFGGYAFGESNPDRRKLYDIAGDREMPLRQAVNDLKQNEILLIGEHHSEKAHHFGQLAVIRALQEAGVRVAVGLEMFRRDSQPSLDRWVRGDMDRPQFQKVYYDNWSFPWPFYSMIFDYALKESIPLVGLNVPKEITGQVAKEGFQSLSEEQRGMLPNIVCNVDREYRDYIKSAFGAHAHGGFNFEYFCEAQLVWDKAMAIHAVEYRKENPDTVLIILAGIAHAWKKGIPQHLEKRPSLSFAVILPEIANRITPATVRLKDADYLLRKP
jgi:uncharacterized iron-regulated protein